MVCDDSPHGDSHHDACEDDDDNHDDDHVRDDDHIHDHLLLTKRREAIEHLSKPPSLSI